MTRIPVSWNHPSIFVLVCLLPTIGLLGCDQKSERAPVSKADFAQRASAFGAWLAALVQHERWSGGAGGKEEKTIFTLEESAYPVEFANYQRNSYVPVETGRGWESAWSRSFSEVDPEMAVSPRAVLASGAFVAVKAASELLLYDTSGSFRFMESAGNPTPLVLGSEAMAYFNETGGLVYQDYGRRKLGEEEPVPGFDEWAYALLIRPTPDEVLGVVQNAGIRGQREKRSYIYLFARDDLTRKWSHESHDIIDHALLTSDGKELVCVAGETVTIYDTGDGRIVGGFRTGIVNPFTASLSLKGDLVMIGTTVDKEGAKRYCRAFSREGKERWSIDLVAPALVQPPVCGEEERVYVIDNMCLKCLSGGGIVWATPPVIERKGCLTLTKGNFALVQSGAALYLYGPDGKRVFESVISREGDDFGTPPAVDGRGRIYVLSDRGLYCLDPSHEVPPEP